MVTKIGTVSGEQVSYHDPRERTINIEDIATGLSHICRFAGQLEDFYSVAQHSVLCAEQAYKVWPDWEFILQVFMHDAAEAYMFDCPSDLKSELAVIWVPIENRLQRAIFRRFAIEPICKNRDLLKTIDRRMALTEKMQLQPESPIWKSYQKLGIQPYDIEIGPMEPVDAKDAFLNFFEMAASNVSFHRLLTTID